VKAHRAAVGTHGNAVGFRRRIVESAVAKGALMRRSTIFLSTTAVLVLSAGLVVGRLSAHLPVGQHPPDHGRGWFQDSLGLTPDQKTKMDAIWADLKSQRDKDDELRRGLDRERDAAIKALLTPEQSIAYDKIFQDYHAHRSDLDKEREQEFRTANERSRALLTADQQVKWDAMSKDMHDRDHRGPGAPGGPGGPPGHGHGPSTLPESLGLLLY
jgi:Spy/CpxP family protein refolding chaperone